MQLGLTRQMAGLEDLVALRATMAVPSLLSHLGEAKATLPHARAMPDQPQPSNKPIIAAIPARSWRNDLSSPDYTLSGCDVAGDHRWCGLSRSQFGFKAETREDRVLIRAEGREHPPGRSCPDRVLGQAAKPSTSSRR